MNCKGTQNRLSAYLDRELPGDEMLAVRTHLHECPRCADEARHLKGLKQLLSNSTAPEPSADFAARLTAAVMAERAPVVSKRTLRWPVITFAGVAACSMALTFIILSAVRPAPTSGPSPVGGNGTSGLAFEVRRDQAYAAGLDATSGAPFISVANDGPR